MYVDASAKQPPMQVGYSMLIKRLKILASGISVVDSYFNIFNCHIEMVIFCVKL